MAVEAAGEVQREMRREGCNGRGWMVLVGAKEQVARSLLRPSLFPLPGRASV